MPQGNHDHSNEDIFAIPDINLYNNCSVAPTSLINYFNDSDLQHMHELQSSRMSADKLKVTLMFFTQNRNNAFNFIKNKMLKNELFKVFITGGAESGKTNYVTELIIAYLEIYCSIFNGRSPVKIYWNCC